MKYVTGILAVCFFGYIFVGRTYQKIDTYEKWVKFVHHEEDNRVFFKKYDRESVDEDFVSLLAERDFHPDYETTFKYEVIDETRVPKNVSKPEKKSLVISGAFDRNWLGEPTLNERRYDIDRFEKGIRHLLTKSFLDPNTPEDVQALIAYLRFEFDYIYIRHDDPNKGALRTIDLPELIIRQAFPQLGTPEDE
jgi:hypothetical protein